MHKGVRNIHIFCAKYYFKFFLIFFFQKTSACIVLVTLEYDLGIINRRIYMCVFIGLIN